MINCIHAEDQADRVDSVICKLGLYGGRPSWGLCEKCPECHPDPNWKPPAPKPFPKPTHRLAPKLAFRAAQNLEVCLNCNHHLDHKETTVKCGLCACNSLPLFATEKCPAGKWEEATKIKYQPQALKFYRTNGPAQSLNKLYSGSAFLVCGGPSLREPYFDLDRLKAPGLLTMAINNSGQPFRPDLFVCVDTPSRFLFSIHRDPRIVKFMPAKFQETFLFNSATEAESKIKAGDCPNTWFYQHRNTFQWWRFFANNIIEWGNSTMMIAIRILYDLGIRRIFLLGADFYMQAGENAYAHGERASKQHAWHNNRSFEQLQRRFGVLNPLFEAHGLYIYNCNPYSRLTAFPFLGYNRAMEIAIEEFGAKPDRERRRGLYEKIENANLGQHTEARPADGPARDTRRVGHLVDPVLP